MSATPSPTPRLALERLARRVGTPAPTQAPWSPPLLPDLIARIDIAVAERRAMIV